MKNKTITLILLIAIILTATMTVAYADTISNVDFRVDNGHGAISIDDDFHKNRIVRIIDDVTYVDAETLLRAVGTSNTQIDATKQILYFSIGDGLQYSAKVGMAEIRTLDLTVDDAKIEKINLNNAPKVIDGKLCLPAREVVEKIYKQSIAYSYEAGKHIVTVTIKD